MYNINPKLWGNCMWSTLHYISFSYPDIPTNVDMENMRIFFTHIGNVLPCEICRHHFNINITKFPLTNDVLKSRYNLIYWLVHFHNEVNIQIGKPIMTIDDVIKKYSSVHNYNIDKNLINISILLLLFFVLLLFHFNY